MRVKPAMPSKQKRSLVKVGGCLRFFLRDGGFLMRNIISLLGGWSSDFWTQEGLEQYDWLPKLFEVLYPLLYAIMAVAAAAGAIYAIVLGINLARADDQSKRDEAKKRLITVIIAVAVTILLVVFFNELLPLIIQAFVDPAGSNVVIDPSTAGQG